ncbi:MAG: RIP metalloprotease RseP [Alphaproteobacteria bacterium]|nr:RIP metalloprotease RseP [Alphaproteobacteria bacterium]
MNITEMVEMLGGNIWIAVGAFLLVITILVFVHEWGHYIVARLCGVRVESFSIGFGKELFGVTDSHGTHWKFSLIPLGGYVKLYGDTDPASAGHTEEVKDGDTVRPMTDSEKKVAFYARPIWKRALIVFAGPGINYIFAIVILAILYMTSGQPLPTPSAAAIVGGSSAEKYGFQTHDLILSIDGMQIRSFGDIQREMMISLNEERHFVVERNGQKVDIYATPERRETTDRFGFKSSTGLLGIISPEKGIQISKIKTIDDQPIEGDDAILAEIENRMGTTFKIGVERGSDTDNLTITPAADYNKGLNDPKDTLYKILILGNRPAENYVKYGPGQAMGKALQTTYETSRDTLRALGQIITGTRSATELGGVIRIAAYAGEVAQQGIVTLIIFMAFLSINLGLINLLPIPMLDGGHLLFYLVEAIIRRPIPEQIQEYAFRAGLVFLVGIMAFANLNDLLQILVNREGS